MLNEIRSFLTNIGSNPKASNSGKNRIESKKKPSSGNPSAPKKTVNIIGDLNKVPAYDEVFTRESGRPSTPKDSERIPISKDLTRDYIALLAKGETNTIHILCNAELLRKKQAVDSNVVFIKESCRDQLSDKTPPRFVTHFAAASIIELLYSNANGLSKSDRASEKDSLTGRVYELFEEALEVNATDIHIELRSTHAIVRFRINSELETVHEWRIDETDSLARLIYGVIAQSGDKDVSFNRKKQQSATLNLPLKGSEVRVRLNTAPAFPGGYDMVMRILRMGSDTGNTTLEDLGYNPVQLMDFEEMIAKPTGVIIIAGTTGSGKSTTNTVSLKTIIEREMGPKGCRIKVITVEDPPEYVIPHATQFPVNSNIGDTGEAFAEAVKAALRCDPDIIGVGEVRNHESATLLTQAVLSGHQAFTTLHAQSIFIVITRLMEIGVSPSILGTKGFIAGLVYQALVPVLCQSCSVPYSDYVVKDDADSKLIDRLKYIESIGRGSVESVRFRNHQGCDKCRGGVTGMTVLAETLVPDDITCELFSEGRVNDARRLFIQRGGMFAVDHGIEKVLAGISCPFDVEDKTGPMVPTEPDPNIDLDDLVARRGSTPSISSGRSESKYEIVPREELRKMGKPVFLDDEDNSEYQPEAIDSDNELPSESGLSGAESSDN